MFHFEYYDKIGLIRLSSPIQFSSTIQPVRMPTDKAPEYVDAIVLGNGGCSSPSAQLQFAALTTYSFTFCQKMFSHVIQWSDAYICAYGRQSTCKGDSGGPLITRADNTLIGILSFGAKGNFHIKPKRLITIFINSFSFKKNSGAQKSYTTRLFECSLSFGVD